MIDKSKELNASISLINDKLNFKGIAGDNNPLSIDYIPPLGDNSGYTSLELLLLSLSSCIGSAVLTFLRKMKKKITSFEINSKGIRKEEHPTGFKSIFIEINLKSSDVTEDDLNKVIKLTKETYCPVWSMLKGNVEVEVKYNIISFHKKPYKLFHECEKRI
ncbi:MAG TPA: OsmC family protein [Ignavibacteria bacterium]|jgi:putative redox protein